MIKRAILALALIAGIVPAFGQTPPPVPALPDTERRTTYSISGTTCACAVGFQLFGDSTDYVNWLEVFVNGMLIPQSGGWTISSPTGPIATIPRPITDAVLTFTTAQTGTVQIVGARRPRRTTQFQESQPVPTRNFNQTFSDIIATQRELWDKTNDFTGRGVFARPGETLAFLPILANRLNQGACFDSGGNLTTCVSIPSSTFIAGSGITFTGVGPTTISCTPFTPSLPGCVPLSGGGTTTFLRADGTFAVPPVPTANYQPTLNITNPPYNAKCNFGFKGDVAMAVSSSTLTSASGGFSVGDVGKYIIVQGAGANITTASSVITGSSPSIATGSGNAFAANQFVTFNFSAGSNIVANSPYYVSATGLSGAAFQVSLTPGGAVITPNGSSSGVAFTSGNLVTTVATFVNATTVTLTAGNTSGNAAGARIAEYGNDDAPAINSAISDANTGGGGTVYIPGGHSCLVSQINFTNITRGVTLKGEGVSSSVLWPLQVAAYSTGHGHVIDLTGSAQVILQDFQLGGGGNLPLPATGIFMAQVASNVSNRVRMNRVYISGQYGGATLYVYGVPSWDCISSDFYNYSPGAGNHGVAYFTNNNAFSYTSSFASVVAPGATSTSDIHFFDTEFHKFAGVGADNWVNRFDATTNVAFYGGVISGGATAYNFYDNTVVHMSFFNVTHETEGQTVIPTYGHDKISGTITDLTDIGSSYIVGSGTFNTAPATTALVKNAL
jgi:hypothetical protein